MKRIRFEIEKKKPIKEDIYSDYDKDEDGNFISCCGDILDPDIMICPTCKEHN